MPGSSGSRARATRWSKSGTGTGRRSNRPTVVTVSCHDQTGLGCDLCRLVLLFGLNVFKGDMSTDGRWCYIRLRSPPRAGDGPWTGTSSRSGWWSFVRTALEQTRLRTGLTPHPSQVGSCPTTSLCSPCRAPCSCFLATLQCPSSVHAALARMLCLLEVTSKAVTAYWCPC